MPLVRYFFYVGAVLVALLIISDAYLPKMPMPESAAADLSMIRIRSDRKWPERVVFDTSSPAFAAVQTANADLSAAAAKFSAEVRVREAFAQIPAPAPKPIEASDPPKPLVKAQRTRKVAKKRAAPPMVLVARQPPFGFFATSTW